MTTKPRKPKADPAEALLENPKARGIYKRRPYNAERHCGAPRDRSVESYAGRIAKSRARMAELDAVAATRELTIIEKKRYKRSGRAVRWNEIELEKIELYGPDDRPCVRVKGQETSHPGTGLCFQHCDCQGRQGFHGDHQFQYSRNTKDKQLRAVMDRIQSAHTDLLNLEPEVLLLKGRTQLFIDRKQDDDPETVRSLTILMEQIRKTVDSMNDKKFKASISMEMYNLIMIKMAEVLMQWVTDPEVLDKIMKGWDRISVESTANKNTALLAGAVREGA